MTFVLSCYRLLFFIKVVSKSVDIDFSIYSLVLA